MSSSTEAPEPTLCRGCGAKLESDFDTDYQFDNALWIRFDGGYGMFVDPLDDTSRIAADIVGQPIPWPIGGDGWTEEQTAEYRRREWFVNRFVICHECAHDLCDKVPWINEVIDPHNSHAHRPSYIEAHPEHTGWDIERRTHG